MNLASYILIVDDETAVRDLLKMALRPMNLAVREAADGVEALDEIASRRPQLIILDLMMPRMGGVDVLRTLRDNPETANLPVLVFSAFKFSADQSQDLKVPPAMVMNKGSLSIRALRTAVLQALYSESLPC